MTSRRDFLKGALFGAAMAAASRLTMGSDMLFAQGDTDCVTPTPSPSPSPSPSPLPLPSPSPTPSPTPPPAIPENYIIFLADDGDRGMGDVAMPKLRERMSEEAGWTEFSDAVCNHPLCAPSRATLLTGRYDFQHGVYKNTDKGRFDGSQTLATWLGSDYRSGFFDKWLHGRQKRDGVVGWDVFQKSSPIEFIRSSDERPFFMQIGVTAMHRPGRPSGSNSNAELDLPPIPENDPDISDRPPWVRKATSASSIGQRKRCYQGMLNLDDEVDSVIEELKSLGKYENTVIIVTSDHGYTWQNKIGGKGTAYQSSSGVPLFIRDPRSSAQSRKTSRVTSTVDIPATILARTGKVPTLSQMGRDLTPLLAGADPEYWDDFAFMAGGGYRPSPNGIRWSAVRDSEYCYILTRDNGVFNFVELYHYPTDPHEHTNLAMFPENDQRLAEMATRVLFEEGRS